MGVEYWGPDGPKSSGGWGDYGKDDKLGAVSARRSDGSRWVSLFAIDGGNTTGVCYGAFPVGDGVDGMRDSVRRSRRGGKLTYLHVEPRVDGLGRGSLGSGDLGELSVIKQVGLLLADWRSASLRVGLGDPRVLIEDFILKGKHPGRSRNVLSSVKIAYGVMGYSIGAGDYSAAGSRGYVLPSMFTPGQSKGFATTARMRDWGLWRPGMPHANDAARLIALWLRLFAEGKVV